MPTPLRHMYASQAEVARSTAGPLIATDFRQMDAGEVAKNGFTVVGAVPIRRGEGAIYPGTNNNYITLPVAGRINKPVLNFVLEFWPYYAADDGVDHYLINASTDSCRFRKEAANSLFFSCGGVGLITSVLATYQPYWYTNQRNVLVVAAFTGNTTMWLNKVQIGTSANAWAATDYPTLYLGARFSGTLTHSGKIGMFKVFMGSVAADLLTAREAADYYDAG